MLQKLMCCFSMSIILVFSLSLHAQAQPTPTPDCDLNNDCIVDDEDLILFMDHWQLKVDCTPTLTEPPTVTATSTPQEPTPTPPPLGADIYLWLMHEGNSTEAYEINMTSGFWSSSEIESGTLMTPLGSVLTRITFEEFIPQYGVYIYEFEEKQSQDPQDVADPTRVFPDGNYFVQVQSSTHVWERVVSLSGEFACNPIITYPPHNSTDIPLTPNISWTCSEAAAFDFIIRKTSGEEIYNELLIFPQTSVQMPPGVLAPNTDYEITVESMSSHFNPEEEIFVTAASKGHKQKTLFRTGAGSSSVTPTPTQRP